MSLSGVGGSVDRPRLISDGFRRGTVHGRFRVTAEAKTISQHRKNNDGELGTASVNDR